MNIICEGIDRVGKNSFLEGLLNKFGYFATVHSSKPFETQHYLDKYPNENPLKMFQLNSFITQMTLLKIAENNNINIMLNRSWIGEAIYSPLYRNYSGDYVFELEKDIGILSLSKTFAFLLYTDNYNLLIDDGESFNVDNQSYEAEKFDCYFSKSLLPKKCKINVHDGNGNFKNKGEIINEALNFINKH